MHIYNFNGNARQLGLCVCLPQILYWGTEGISAPHSWLLCPHYQKAKTRSRFKGRQALSCATVMVREPCHPHFSLKEAQVEGIVEEQQQQQHKTENKFYVLDYVLLGMQETASY